MGGSFGFFAPYLSALLAVLLLAFPFVLSLAVRVIVGPRERLVARGFQMVGLIAAGAAVSVAGAKVLGTVLRRLDSMALFSALEGLTAVAFAAIVVWTVKAVAETSWWRALATLALTGAVYAGLYWAVS